MKNSSDNMIGSVMVVGGGIAGVQAALDMADTGYLVYLVENTAAIGGTMSALDKTFPTNDCSMCILSPKLVECGRHRNINLITCADVERVEGSKGNFNVTVRRNPRYIDLSKCTACGDCANACPVDLSNEYDQGLSDRKAVYKKYAQAIPGAFSIDKLDKAPCRMACPANLNVQGYVQMVKQGKFREAIEIIMRDLPFPGTLGRVCPHACEKSCRRLEIDEAVSIRELKRVAADNTNLSDIPVPEIQKRAEKVAIIGSGPAGLTAAYFLAQDGYQVSVYEAMPEAGGMMRYGIPEHRLPRSVLDAEINNLKRYGIEIHTNTVIGKDLTIEELQQHGAKAVFLGAGAWKGLKLRIQGEESKGVADVTSFLRNVHLGKLKKLEGKSVIIGGGHSALDGARVALRLGAVESHIIYRRSKTEMLAEPEEIEEAEKEGVKIHFLVAPVKISNQDGKVTGIECIRTRLTEPDTTGRRKPVPIEGTEFTIAADHIIPAIGQEPDLAFLGEKSGLEVSKWNLLVVNPETLQTNIPGIFAGGDVITGPATVIEAVDAGKKAAGYIAKYLQGEQLPEEWQEEPPMGTNWIEIPDDEPVKHRLKAPTLAVEKRLGGFEEVNLTADEESAKAEAARCLNCGGCCECYECVKTCKAQAVTLETHAQKEEILSINVGAVILAPGFTPFDPSQFSTYQYATFENVVTSMEYERILSATGPSQGHLVRPSDHKEPRKVAWLQCIGSRDINRCDNGYCSSVCCTYAIKEAVISKEHSGGDLECAIFFMDMRTHGKEFEKYYDSAREKHGVRFIRARVHTIEQVKDSDDLRLNYVNEQGEIINEIFDMVVLSVGLEIPSDMVRLADRMGIALTEGNFCKTGAFRPVATSREGIYVCGAFAGPKDIPQSVMEASSAAADAGALLSNVRNTMTREKKVPEERDISAEEPRIGVFVCHCGINIGSVVDVPDVKAYAGHLPHVVYADQNLFTCSQDTQDRMKEVIREHRLNRIVVASCSPRTHEPLFQQTIQEAGLNKYLFELANIRDQNSWVHQKAPEAATEKAKDLIRMAVAKVALQEPLREQALGVTRSGLVIGGGVAGMEAALSLAGQGYPVTLVEAAPMLGGNAKFLNNSWSGASVADYLKGLIIDVNENPLITVHLNAVVEDVRGFVGNFSTILDVEGAHEEISHGVAIIATGGGAYQPNEYQYGKSGRIYLSLDLDRAIKKKDETVLKAQSAVFIQCVGSREPERPYCSRVCCTHSIESALALKELNPDMKVCILYRDIRTYGLRERLYQEARKKGVLFFRFDADQKPRVTVDGDRLEIEVFDHVLQRTVLMEPDILTLASAIVPGNTESLAKHFKVPRNQEGFFLEAHMKLRPVDFATDGVYVAGLSHYPKPIEECIAQAKAAAARAATVLSRDSIMAGGIAAFIDKERCCGCHICVECCPFGAISYVEAESRSEVNQALCKGCGTCAAACTSEAISLMGFSYTQLYTQIEQALVERN